MKRAVKRGAAVLLAVAAATALTEASAAVGAELTFEWYVAAVACVAWWCGRRTGIAAALVSSLVSDFLFLPYHRFTLAMEASEAIRLATFVGLALLVTHLVTARDSAEHERAGRERMAAVVAHELANLIRAFQTWTAVLERGDARDDERSRAARALARTTHALATLSGDLVDWEQIASGRIDLAPEHFDLAQVVEDTVDEVREDAATRGVTLSCSLYSAPVHADRDRLHQVALGVLGDALKAARPGARIDVSVRCTERRVVLAVHGDGPAVPLSWSDALDPEIPVDDRTASFGVALARRLVRAQGGDVTTYGGGFRGSRCSVLVRLPAAGVGATAAGAVAAPG